MLEIKVYSIIISKVFGVTIAIKKFCHCKINVQQLQMGGSSRKDGAKRWRGGKNVVWLFK
jgi:hypothetical protein